MLGIDFGLGVGVVMALAVVIYKSSRFVAFILPVDLLIVKFETKEILNV